MLFLHNFYIPYGSEILLLLVLSLDIHCNFLFCLTFPDLAETQQPNLANCFGKKQEQVLTVLAIALSKNVLLLYLVMLARAGFNNFFCRFS